MDENILKILKMLEEKKINSEEAYKLLNAAEQDKTKNKKIVIRVKGPNENVNISIPLGVVIGLIKLSGKFTNLIPDSAKEKMEEKDIEKIQKIIENLGDAFPEMPQVLIEGKEKDKEFYIGIE